jgi:hypothetical protein
MALTMPRREHIIIAIVGCLLFIHAATAVHRSYALIDFRPMYCAGQAVLAHQDPYAVEPLRTCEISHGLAPDGAVVPAPVPGYVLGLFAATALVRYDIAGVLFCLLSVTAFLFATWCTARLSGLSWVVATAGLFWTCGYGPINLGQLSVFALLALTACALAAQRGHWNLAAGAACATLIQPQFGLPVVLALGFWSPGARRPLLIGLAILGALTLSTLGIAGNELYFTSELPHHAASEVSWPFQLSLTWLLKYAGLSERLAVAAGSASYVLCTIAGLFAAHSFARRDERALAILTPAAFAMLGGSYVHIQQIATMLPLALILVGRARRGTGFAPALGALLLGLNPFARAIEIAAYVGCMVFAIYESLATTVRNRRRIARECAAIAAIGGVLILGCSRLPSLDQSAQHLDRAALLTVIHTGSLASDQWKVAADLAYQGKAVAIGLVADKTLIWLGIALVLGFTLAAAVNSSLLRAVNAPVKPADVIPVVPLRPFAPSKV